MTAPSTDQGKDYGYVFWNCRLTSDKETSKVYLARPWRPYAQVVYIECELGKHIVPAGWNNWGKASNEKTAFFAEYKSTGEGASPNTRVPYSHQLTDITRYQPEKVLAGNDGWNPLKNGNALLTDIKR